MTSLACLALLALHVAFAAGEAWGQTRLPLVAVLFHGPESGLGVPLDQLREGLRERGWVEGRNYRLELHWTDSSLERLSELARELPRLNPDVAIGLPNFAARALARESKTMPIVTVGVGMLYGGMIASLARPGGNVTGINLQTEELTQKQFELLREAAPRAKRVLALSSGRAFAEYESELRDAARGAARALDMTLIEAVADSPAAFDEVSSRCERERCEALVLLTDPILPRHQADIFAMATRLRLPVVSPYPAFARDRALIAYATDTLPMYRRGAHYVDRILKGAKPADLPVEQPTKFELIVNLKTAKALGLTIPESILVRADEVIE